MIPNLLEAAARSAGLALIVWLALKAMRVRCPQTRSLVWTAVLLAALCMPPLMLLTEKLIAAAPATSVRWIFAISAPLPSLHPGSFAPPAALPASIDWESTAIGLYVLVAVLLGIRLFAGAWRAATLVRESIPVRQPWAEGWDVRVSHLITIPVTCGSTILLPGDFQSWNDFKLRAVLLHEQAHVLRRDYYFHLLAGLHRTIFWFSPLAWWLQAQLVKLAELVADDAAVRKLGDPFSYADVLIETAEKGSRFGFVAPGMAGGNNIEHRIERLLDAPRSAPVSLFRKLATAALVVPLAALSASAWAVRAEPPSPPVVTFQQPDVTQEPIPAPAPAAPSAPVKAPVPEQAPPTPKASPESGILTQWSREEVASILNQDERSAFERLKSDEEREAFIVLFWLRRDPTPGTIENEYRDEYYRRIALANQRFGSADGTPGWRSDRGRVLIRFGEPDEIQKWEVGRYYRSEGQGGTVSTFPFEKWRYRRVEGLGNNVELEFVDSSMTGDFRLTFDVSEEDRILHLPGDRQPAR